MCFRFRKIIERPDWRPAMAVTLEITYEADPVELDYDDDQCQGGVYNVQWEVVRLHGYNGQYHNPDAFHEAERLLCIEDGLEEEIQDACLQDFAQRDAYADGSGN